MTESFQRFQQALSELKLAVEAQYYESEVPDSGTKLVMDMLQTAQEQFRTLHSAFSNQRGISSVTLEAVMRNTLDELFGTLTAVENMMGRASAPDTQTPLKACRDAATGIQNALSPRRN